MAEYTLSRADLNEICKGREEELTEQLSHVHTEEEFREFFLQKKVPGLWVKDIMKLLGIPDKDIPPERQDRLDWILRHVEIEGVAGAAQPSAPEAPAETPEPETPDVSVCSLPLEQVRKFMETVDGGCLQPAKEIDVTPATIHEDMPVQYQDDFLVKAPGGFYEGLAVILRADNRKLAATASLRRDGNMYHILMERGQIDYSAFHNQRKYLLGLFAADAAPLFAREKLEKSDGLEFHGVISTASCTIDYKPKRETANTLCIDFGTSNTSVGSYGVLHPEESHRIELVSFVDVTTPEMRQAQMYPTLVYVDDCGDADNVRYLFGYEARRQLIEKDYDTEASVFFEIKRWISSLDREEELRDEQGHSVTVLRRDIVKAYLLHVIDLAEQYFKTRFRKLHLSAPVKLKTQFYREMKAMLCADGSRTVLKPSDSVDEGVAIIYDSISRLIDNEEIQDGEKTSIMILDCGGGTTDLASCEIVKEQRDAGTMLRVSTQFVNGNSNFGGNNITFRIMQLLKIKLAEKYAPDFMGDCTLQKLIPMEESQVLCKVEEDPQKGSQYNSDDLKNEIYADFQKAYERAENIIPTIYVDNPRFRFAGELGKIRRNYYYLWQLAEKVKIRFYEDDMVSIDLRPVQDKPLEFDRSVMYYLYAAEDGELVRKQDAADGIEITINELRRLLCGDIFGLLNELLCAKDFQIDAYKYYRLAGQSCKISLFMDLLKEFIPGRKLRVNPIARGEDEPKGSARLKLDCIKGCIAYVRDRECSLIHPEIQAEPSRLIYDVAALKAGREVEPLLLSHASPEEIHFVPVTRDTTHIELIVKNTAGYEERRFTVEFRKSDGKFIEGPLEKLFEDVAAQGAVDEASLQKLQNDIIAVDPEDIDQEKYVRLAFAIPSSEGYGMQIYRLLKQNSPQGARYGWWVSRYENYENESTKSFFDGSR